MRSFLLTLAPTLFVPFVALACLRKEIPATQADEPEGSFDGVWEEPPAPQAERVEADQLEADQLEAVPAEAVPAAPAREPERTPDVVYVPTPQLVVDKMLDLVRLKKTDLLYDLGCGDGRIVITAAKKYGVRAVGFDIDPERVDEARENVRRAGVEKLVTIEERDIFTLDLSPANVVALYLLPELNVKLIPQLDKLRPGSRIISHDFDMKGVKPDRYLRFTPREADAREHELFLFTTPLKKVKE